MSNKDNPHFTHIERAPYELGSLLRQLPADLSSVSVLSQETTQLADAAMQHADNANSTLTHGLEAIGNLMFVVGANEENTIEKSTLSDLGCLIAHMAQEAQFLQETSYFLNALLQKQTERKTRGAS